MNTGIVIIGANYGDEGKGLMTDYFASQDPQNTLVVRFNGGAQAGHTVVSPTGIRHVFSHFGSGTLQNCPTYLSKFFIVNPMLCLQEREQLMQMGMAANLILHPQSMMTTPFDMVINQQIEIMRNADRHGSCGVGINETVTRCNSSLEFKTTVGESKNKDELHRKLKRIEQDWFPNRLKDLGIDVANDSLKTFRQNSKAILEKFIDESTFMRTQYEVTDLYPEYKTIIFEGAQGLMLDEDRIDQFPHVTRSKTGLPNVLYLAPKFKIESLQVTYATRTYMTRHGAGPLKDECDWKFVDATNIPNQFQGTLRFAPLNLETLRQNIEMDLIKAKHSKLQVNANIAMTCADQRPTPDMSDFFLPVSYVSYGPTREDVTGDTLERCRRLSKYAIRVK